MFEDPNREDNQQELLSVEELEGKIKANPNDVNLKEDLAAALVDRYLYGDEKKDSRSPADIKRLREALADLPQENAPHCRAYVAHLDKKNDEAVEQLVRWAKGSDSSKPAEPLSADELQLHMIQPFADAPAAFWSKLADALEMLWPQSPATLTVKGYVEEWGKYRGREPFMHLARR